MLKRLKRRKESNDEEIIFVLQELVTLLEKSDESPYSGIESKDIIAMIEQESNKLRVGEKANYNELKALLCPTGPIQEISIDNGWGDAFIELANRYDSATQFRS